MIIGATSIAIFGQSSDPVIKPMCPICVKQDQPRARHPMVVCTGKGSDPRILITTHITDNSRPLITYYDIEQIDSNSSIIG